MKLSECPSPVAEVFLLIYVIGVGAWGVLLGATGNISGAILCIIVLMWVDTEQSLQVQTRTYRTMCENLLRMWEEKR